MPILLNEFAPPQEEYQIFERGNDLYEALPWGIFMRAEPRQTHRNWDTYFDESGHVLTSILPPPRIGRDGWDHLAHRTWMDAYFYRALFLTFAMLENKARPPLALRALDEAGAIPGQDMSRIYMAKGYVYEAMVPENPQAKDLARQAWQEYLRATPQQAPGRTDVEHRIKAL